LLERKPLRLLKPRPPVLEGNFKERRNGIASTKYNTRLVKKGALIVSELSFVVHFSVARLQRFTYGNSTATLVAVCTTLGALRPPGERGNNRIHANICDLYTLWRSRDYERRG
jgi:hypothetical protein